MSIQIIKSYVEKFPALRLIGKRYTNADRINGNFSSKWHEWFQKQWFAEIEINKSLPCNDNAYLGVMRINNNEFEYWIGMFFDKDAVIPPSFDYVDIDEFTVMTCWLYGNNNSIELFDMNAHNLCLKELEKHNYTHNEGSLCIEKYNCPRYTTADEYGNVILDYCISIHK